MYICTCIYIYTYFFLGLEWTSYPNSESQYSKNYECTGTKACAWSWIDLLTDAGGLTHSIRKCARSEIAFLSPFSKDQPLFTEARSSDGTANDSSTKWTHSCAHLNTQPGSMRVPGLLPELLSRFPWSQESFWWQTTRKNWDSGCRQTCPSLLTNRLEMLRKLKFDV